MLAPLFMCERAYVLQLMNIFSKIAPVCSVVGHEDAPCNFEIGLHVIYSLKLPEIV